MQYVAGTAADGYTIIAVTKSKAGNPIWRIGNLVSNFSRWFCERPDAGYGSSGRNRRPEDESFSIFIRSSILVRWSKLRIFSEQPASTNDLLLICRSILSIYSFPRISWPIWFKSEQSIVTLWCGARRTSLKASSACSGDTFLLKVTSTSCFEIASTDIIRSVSCNAREKRIGVIPIPWFKNPE